jgi:HSP20 family molecular chaperone IbpA
VPVDGAGAVSEIFQENTMSTVSLWTRRDPFAEFDALVRNAFGPVATWSTRRPTGFTPAAEVTRDGDDAVVRVELPGVDVAKDVTVEIDRGRLVVRGERRDERTDERDGRSLREVRYGSFQRSFGLPAHVTADAVSASYDAGVLSVRVAGVHAGSEARRIEITSGTQEAPATESGEDTAN